MERHIDLNRVPINGDELELYFTKIFTSFDVLKAVYSSVKTKESNIIYETLEKLEKTFIALRFKYLYDSEKSLNIDKTESGFPHFHEFDKLEVDIKNLDTLKMDVKNVTFLKEELVNCLLSKEDNEAEESYILKDLSFALYVQFLDRNGLFLPFNKGELDLLEDNGDHKIYSYYWSTYDVETNMPYVYIMTFESSGETEVDTFLSVVKSVGNRAPKLNILAASIDDALDYVHPKTLKRVAIGPFYSSRFAEDLNDQITKVFQFGDDGRKFLLFIEDEFVYSHKQVKSNSIFSKDKLREIFFVPEWKSELYEKGVSDISKKVILPYKLHQHIADFCVVDKIYSFDTGGNIHGIK